MRCVSFRSGTIRKLIGLQLGSQIKCMFAYKMCEMIRWASFTNSSYRTILRTHAMFTFGIGSWVQWNIAWFKYKRNEEPNKQNKPNKAMMKSFYTPGYFQPDRCFHIAIVFYIFRSYYMRVLRVWLTTIPMQLIYIRAMQLTCM